LANLSQSRLLNEEQIAEISQRFVTEDPTEELVSSLVQEGRLTSYQIKQLLAGQTKGLVLGQYRILEELGRGGYGCVYKARHNLMERVVALKVITPDLVQDERIRGWFRREVLASTQLNHPNIVLAYDADEVDGVLFLAMEYIEGLNLEALVKEQGPVPIAVACEMLQQSAKALQFAHEKGMVHRDIKPANLLIPKGAVAELGAHRPQFFQAGNRPVLVKVVDFGLARLHSSSATNTIILQNEKGFVGTPAYVSPEQARNVHAVDIRSDLYSLGCTFYYALTGQPPFKAATVLETVMQHLEKEPEPLEKHRAEVPPALASMIRRLMAKKSEKRFQTPADLLAELGFFFGLGGSLPHIDLPALKPMQGPATDSQPVEQPIADRHPPQSECNLEVTRVAWNWNVPIRNEERGITNEECPSSTLVPQAPSAPSAVGAHTVTAGPADDVPISNQSPEVQTRPPTYTKPEPFVPDLSLLEAWQQWTALIESGCGGKNPRIQEVVAYQDLHQRLLEGCRAGAQHPLFRQMAEIVEPWLLPQTLAATDRETLASLWLRCQQINEKLGISKRNIWPLVAILIGVIILAGIGWLLTQGAGRIRTLPIVGMAWSFVASHPILSLAVVLPLVILGAIILLGRLR
jgi:serine/threonine protein kinase